MPSRNVEQFIVDILLSIDKIKRKVGEVKTVNDFVEKETIFDATMRSLEVIGEAAKYILKSGKYLDDMKEEWRKIVSFRNIVAHEYFGIDYNIIFEIVTKKVPELECKILNLISKNKNNEMLKCAMKDAKQELSDMNRKNSLEYITKLETIIKE